MARILCVNPWIYDFAAYNLWIEPLGLLAVAAVLRDAGHEVSLIDCLDRCHPVSPAPSSPRDRYGLGQFAKYELPKPPVLAHVPRRWGRYGLPVDVFETELDAQPHPDAVLVTCAMTYWHPGAFEAIRRIKARWPAVPVALGGVYATLCTDHAVAHSGADAVLPGAGEERAQEWIAGLGLGGSKEGQARVLPAHDLRRPQGYVAVQTARGCPYHCPYCAVHLLAPGAFSTRPVDEVVREIAWSVDQLGARDVVFYDDALLCYAEAHLHPLLDQVIARRLPVRFHTPNGLHARFLDRRLAVKMRRAGFVSVRLGLESADPEQQRRDGDKVDDEAFAQAVSALFAAGFTSRDLAAYVLFGRPGQSIETVRGTVAYAQRLGVPVQMAQFSPIPGTAEWQEAVRVGCIAPDADPLLHNNSAYPCADMPEMEALKVQVRSGNRALLGL